MRFMRVTWLLLLAVSMAWAQSGGPKPMKSLDLDAMDTSANPCEDFFQYACGKWNANNPIPPDQSRWGRFDELRERNRYVLRDILEKYQAKGPKRTAVEQKIGDYYDACMDQAAVEKKNLKPLQPYLKTIDKMKSKAGLTKVLVTLHDAGSNALFGFGAVPQLKNSSTTGAWADQGGLGLPNKDFYFKDDAKSAEIRTKYVEHVGRMLELLGEPPAASRNTAAAIMKLETTLAKGALDPVSRRNPNNLDHWMKRSDFEALAPSIQWTLYYEGVGAPAFTELNVANPDFFQGLEAALKDTDLATLKAYLKWRLVTLSAEFLPERFQQENFNFFQKTLQGAKEIQPRWKRCSNAVDGDLGQALGQKYVELTFGAEGKERALKMVNALEKALERDIEQLDWMGPETKQRAQEKLHAILNIIGYPDQWRDYSALVIKRGDALGNSLRSNAFENRRQLRKIGNPVDRKEWGFTPPTVNASYSPLQNRISFPAGILQPPFYSNQIDDAVNFGAIGVVIGHELTHGFDDSGRRYDPKGNLRDWWTPEDGKEFERRAACVADQYSGYSPIEGVKLNGKLTLGENVADNGGSRIALMALWDTLGGKIPEKIDGFTAEQRFFVGFGQIWCQNVTPERERTSALTDPHSPGRFRVNGVVSNSPEFQKAFSCKQGQAMVRVNACRVW